MTSLGLKFDRGLHLVIHPDADVLTEAVGLAADAVKGNALDPRWPPHQLHHLRLSPEPSKPAHTEDCIFVHQVASPSEARTALRFASGELATVYHVTLGVLAHTPVSALGYLHRQGIPIRLLRDKLIVRSVTTAQHEPEVSLKRHIQTTIGLLATWIGELPE